MSLILNGIFGELSEQPPVTPKFAFATPLILPKNLEISLDQIPFPEEKPKPQVVFRKNITNKKARYLEKLNQNAMTVSTACSVQTSL